MFRVYWNLHNSSDRSSKKKYISRLYYYQAHTLFYVAHSVPQTDLRSAQGQSRNVQPLCPVSPRAVGGKHNIIYVYGLDR